MNVNIDEKTLNIVREMLSKVKNEIKIFYFALSTQQESSSDIVEEILSLLNDLNDKIRIIKVTRESSLIKKFKIEKFPALVIHGEMEYNIRYFGTPMGYEFGVLIEDIIDVSKGKPDLPENIINALVSIDKEVHIQVFVTPTCPYCPTIARAAHMYAIVNLNIISDVIEANEFPDLIEKYNIYAVPKVVINEEVEFEGIVPHEFFIEKILEAL